jgi:cell wall-associated NlpC family hydrolase
MKLIACALPLLASVPGVLFAQIKVGATLGPVAVVATLGGRGVTLRATAEPARPSHAPPAVVPAGTTSSSAARILATAKRFLGTRYRYGGSTPGSGFDCSGFVQYVFHRNGIDLPRTSRQQAAAGRLVKPALAALKPGDLMLFSSNGGRIDHVAIYVGNNRMLHSSAGAGKVVYDDLSTPRGAWYLARHVTSRRVL